MHSIEETKGREPIEKTLTIVQANVIAAILTLPTLSIFLTIHARLWGSLPEIPQLPGDSVWLDIVIMLAILSVSVIVHEGLHGLGFIFGGASPAEISFGFKDASPYAHCTVPLRLGAYRVAVALPAIILGIVPGFAGLATGEGFLTLYGTIMVLAALGDVQVLWLLRDAPRKASVKDHPTLVGCQIWLPEGHHEV